MTFKSRLTTAIATGAVLINALAPLALADSTITVSGNGADSHSGVNISNTSVANVTQNNTANITNNVTSNASTGGNSSSFNTGGNTTIQTGNANNTVNVTNAANANQANLSNCGCNGDGTNVTVGGSDPQTGNGAFSGNNVNVTNDNETFLNQTNAANYNNNVTVNATTGGNDSQFNTGGNSKTVTGSASNTVTVTNVANANIANLGGGNGGSSDPSSVTIAGNGAFSGNNVDLKQGSIVVLDQSNDATINNNVKANAKTGDNESQFNTGGNNKIQTGNATDNVTVNNLANFNAASIDCDCTMSDLGVKVAGNGDKSWNTVNATSNDAVFPDQENGAGLGNKVSGGAETGSNDVGFSTGSVFGDPSVSTGASSSTTNVGNAGNVNVLDNGASVTLPGNWNVGVNFDLSGLTAFLNGFNGLI